MQRILVVSDTHGRTDMGAIARLAAHVEHVVHLGDGFNDGTQLTILLDRPVVQVQGNVDAPLDLLPEKLMMVEGWPILLTHGHHYRVKQGLDLLVRRAQAQEARAVLFGHIHQRVAETRDGVWLFCPSSPAYTSDGTSPAVGLLRVTRERIEHEWVPVARS